MLLDAGSSISVFRTSFNGSICIDCVIIHLNQPDATQFVIQLSAPLFICLSTNNNITFYCTWSALDVALPVKLKCFNNLFPFAMGINCNISRLTEQCKIYTPA